MLYGTFVAFVGVSLLAVAGVGAWVCWMAGDVSGGLELRLLGGAVALGAVSLAAAYGYALLAPRRPWAWRYHVALLIIGIPLCAPLALPLLFFWLRGNIKRQFMTP